MEPLERLLSLGLHRALALKLVESHQMSVAQAAKVADLSLEEFIELTTSLRWTTHRRSWSRS